MKKHVKKPWSASDMKVLREKYPHQLTAHVAALLGRPITAVQKMAQMNGIRKTHEALSSIRLSSVPRTEASIACRFKPRHGRTGKNDLTYQSWSSMKQRCLYPGHKSYPSYGGAGITICDKWMVFDGFLEDMGECPRRGMSIDRIDGTLGYFPGNCRWATASQQARNRRSTRWISAFGEVHPMIEWCRRYGISQDTLAWRLKAGLSIEEALTKPLMRSGRAGR